MTLGVAPSIVASTIVGAVEKGNKQKKENIIQTEPTSEKTRLKVPRHALQQQGGAT
ncbi:MAG: hypothetical protein JW849_10315 [Phycisphaerae bacterium]|nr:hypothetical protein [Phycisphaerae bacterium]